MNLPIHSCRDCRDIESRQCIKIIHFTGVNRVLIGRYKREYNQVLMYDTFNCQLAGCCHYFSCGNEAAAVIVSGTGL
jgi:hypothetical protein